MRAPDLYLSVVLVALDEIATAVRSIDVAYSGLPQSCKDALDDSALAALDVDGLTRLRAKLSERELA